MQLFGDVLREEYYLLDKNLFFTNHGSYGSVPKPIFEKRQQLQLEMESAPDPWFRYKMTQKWDESRKALADFLNVNVEHLLLVENATYGTNAILKSIEFAGANEAILIHAYTYQALKNTVSFIAKYRLSEDNQVKVFETPLKYPLQAVDTLLRSFDEDCRRIIQVENLKLKVVLLDHISSGNAMIYPLKELIAIVRKWDLIQGAQTFVVVDGAHAIGQLDIKLNDLDCDFYVSNLHKWFFSPRGCAFLYFKDIRHALTLKPNITSHFFSSEASVCFDQRGTRDSTSFYLVKDCIKFHVEFLGGYQAIRNYCTGLLEQAVKLLTDSWGTYVLEMPVNMQAPFMRNIKLPKVCDDSMYVDKMTLFNESLRLIKLLYEKYKIIAVVIVLQGELYVRISAFVYNRMEDYNRLNESILDIHKNFI